jgi:hypothetical protein
MMLRLHRRMARPCRKQASAALPVLTALPAGGVFREIVRCVHFPSGNCHGGARLPIDEVRSRH